MGQVDRCTQSCQQPVQKVEEFVNEHISRFQNRLNRCAQNCQDDIKDQAVGVQDPGQIARLQGAFDACVTDCCKKSLDSIPAMKENIEATLTQFSKPAATATPPSNQAPL